MEEKLHPIELEFVDSRVPALIFHAATEAVITKGVTRKALLHWRESLLAGKLPSMDRLGVEKEYIHLQHFESDVVATVLEHLTPMQYSALERTASKKFWLLYQQQIQERQ